MATPPVHRWIKTECGRAKYAELAARPGPWARLRLIWFVVVFHEWIAITIGFWLVSSLWAWLSR